MIEVLVAAEAPHVSPDPTRPVPGKLARPHLIAVQPFSTVGANFFMQNPSVTIINGHYTQVSKGPANLGAIELVRGYNQRTIAPPPNTVRIICSNEGKISGGLCNPNDPNHPEEKCKAYTADGAQNDGITGDPDAARAEAYQFMASQGGCFDHFGYYMSTTHGRAIRTQLSSLLALMTSPLTNLTQLTPAAPYDEQAPTWINFKNYKDSVLDRTYWSALEPRAGATGVQTYFAYVHHSKPSGVAFDGYDPEIRTGGAGSPYYNPTHKICFSWPANTAFKVDWICPKTGQCKTDSKTWTGTTGCANDGVTLAMPGAMVISPPATFNCPYEYDLAIRIRRTNQGSCG